MYLPLVLFFWRTTTNTPPFPLPLCQVKSTVVWGVMCTVLEEKNYHDNPVLCRIEACLDISPDSAY